MFFFIEKVLDFLIFLKLISSGLEYQCSEEILSIASVLSVQQIFSFSSNNKNAELARRRYAVYEGDHLTLLNGKYLTIFFKCSRK